jgi:hypothetical protein
VDIGSLSEEVIAQNPFINSSSRERNEVKQSKRRIRNEKVFARRSIHRRVGDHRRVCACRNAGANARATSYRRCPAHDAADSSAQTD